MTAEQAAFEPAEVLEGPSHDVPARPAGTNVRAPRKRKRRRPVRRFMIVTHRWLSLVLGVVLIVITTSGAILVLDPQIHHALNANAFAASGGPATTTFEQAKNVVAKAHRRSRPPRWRKQTEC